jgi:hypothetical protein
MPHESYFDGDHLDLDAALLAGFGLKIVGDETSEEEAEDEPRGLLPTDEAEDGHAGHGEMTHRVGLVGNLQVTFAYHHGDHQHD